MKIAQIVSSFSPGDAVSNSAMNFHHIFEGLGLQSKIFAENVHHKAPREIALYSRFTEKHWDVVLYHFAIASNVAEEMTHFKHAKRYILYHNITPSHHFRGYDEGLRNACKDGREQLAMLKDHVECAFTVSRYNAMELQAVGYKNIRITPLWYDSNLDQQPNHRGLEARLTDGKFNVLFVGRLSPHKCQHDIIQTFAILKKHIHPNSRLLLVGSGMDKYVSELEELVHANGLKDVFITGHVSDSELATYYRNAHVFLSMSEHEGFCVPLLEAMNFGVPIVAYDSSAVGETLGQAGIKLISKDNLLIAELLGELEANEEVRHEMIVQQRKRLKDFVADAVRPIIIREFGEEFLGRPDQTDKLLHSNGGR